MKSIVWLNENHIVITVNDADLLKLYCFEEVFYVDFLLGCLHTCLLQSVLRSVKLRSLW